MAKKRTKSPWSPKIRESEVASPPQNITVCLGGRDVIIYEMTLSAAQNVMRILLPHIRSIVQNMMTAMRAEQASDEAKEVKTLEEIKAKIAEAGAISPTSLPLQSNVIAEEFASSPLFGALMDTLAQLPVDMIKIVASAINVDVEQDVETLEFLESQVRLRDLPDLIGAIAEVNDFSGLVNRIVTSFRNIAGRYGVSIKGAPIVEKVNVETQIEDLEALIEEVAPPVLA